MGSILDAFDSVSLTRCLSFMSLLIYKTIQHERVTGHRLKAQREGGIGIELLRQIVRMGWNFSDVLDNCLRDTAEYLTSMYLNPPCFRTVSGVDTVIVCAIVGCHEVPRRVERTVLWEGVRRDFWPDVLLSPRENNLLMPKGAGKRRGGGFSVVRVASSFRRWRGQAQLRVNHIHP